MLLLLITISIIIIFIMLHILTFIKSKRIKWKKHINNTEDYLERENEGMWWKGDPFCLFIWAKKIKNNNCMERYLKQIEKRKKRATWKNRSSLTTKNDIIMITTKQNKTTQENKRIERGNNNNDDDNKRR